MDKILRFTNTLFIIIISWDLGPGQYLFRDKWALNMLNQTIRRPRDALAFQLPVHFTLKGNQAKKASRIPSIGMESLIFV